MKPSHFWLKPLLLSKTTKLILLDSLLQEQFCCNRSKCMPFSREEMLQSKRNLLTEINLQFSRCGRNVEKRPHSLGRKILTQNSQWCCSPGQTMHWIKKLTDIKRSCIFEIYKSCSYSFALSSTVWILQNLPISKCAKNSHLHSKFGHNQ